MYFNHVFKGNYSRGPHTTLVTLKQNGIKQHQGHN